MNSSTTIFDPSTIFIVIVLLLCISVFCYIRFNNKCKHNYVVIKTISMVNEYSNIPVGTKYISRCEKCGNIKKDIV